MAFPIAATLLSGAPSLTLIPVAAFAVSVNIGKSMTAMQKVRSHADIFCRGGFVPPADEHSSSLRLFLTAIMYSSCISPRRAGREDVLYVGRGGLGAPVSQAGMPPRTPAF
jgi:hypothetical protein